MHLDTISTVIPSFNHGALLPRAIESVFAQQGELNLDVIIVDDGSTDATPLVCEQLLHTYPKLRVVRKPNGGLSSARNTGIRAAFGDFIHFLDADDYIEPSMYLKMTRLLNQHPAAAIAYCGFEAIDLAGGDRSRSAGERINGDIRERLLLGNLGPVHALLIRRHAIEATGFFDETLASCEDWDYWLRMAFLEFQFIHLPEVLVYYERGSTSMSRNYLAMIRSAESVLSKAESYYLDDRLEQSRKRGLKAIRPLMFGYSYAGVLRRHLQSGHFRLVARELLAVFREDPESARPLINFLMHHKRAMVHGLRVLLSRAIALRSNRDSV